MKQHDPKVEAEHLESRELLPIGEVSLLTGVNAVTLRAWQRRFGLVIPARTPKGHRLYTPENIQQIHEINAWLAKGVAISKVKPLLMSSALATEVDSTALQEGDLWHEQITGLNGALFELDQQKLHQIFDEALGLYPFQLVKQKLLQAWMAQLPALLEPRLDAELLLAWLESELASRIGGRASFAGQASLAQIGVVCLPSVLGPKTAEQQSGQSNMTHSNIMNSSITNRLYSLVLRLELAELRVSVINLGVLDITSLGLINNRLKVDALLLLPEANHPPSKIFELQSVLEQMQETCYLIGPFAPTLTALSAFMAPDLAEWVNQVSAAKEQHRKQQRKQKNAAEAQQGGQADER
ncbi:MerR family transcriptional regulator [Shewanella decolorationis]|uniref:MerR family transcriptional regulator n=1 Tax=Shewanella decolorationis S12 TaxID=1353536 RepID=A0ABP2Z597_9GAMM|nr:MerR family transcriptional regulator [Shewanella decolorationis]ESE41938.1 MerR family transcriptional regulator [Shewanella decolorationis S12]GLR32141.1 helix-turn-helix-type transcriptional regulator [Shewanella decolorationis]